MSIFKELATLEERIEKDGVYLYVSRMIHKQYWGCDGPLKLITNEEVLSLLRPISNSLCRLPDMLEVIDILR